MLNLFYSNYRSSPLRPLRFVVADDTFSILKVNINIYFVCFQRFIYLFLYQQMIKLIFTNTHKSNIFLDRELGYNETLLRQCNFITSNKCEINHTHSLFKHVICISCIRFLQFIVWHCTNYITVVCLLEGVCSFYLISPCLHEQMNFTCCKYDTKRQI